MEEDGRGCYEFVLDDEQIDSLIIALSEFRRSRNEFEFEIDDNTSVAFYHVDSEGNDDDEDDEKDDEDDLDDEELEEEDDEEWESEE
jgi:hypothetical protein